MPNGIINRSYYAASEQGRQDAQAEQINALRQRAMQSDLEQENYLRGIMRDPNSTPEQFARAGRSDIANSIVGRQNANQAAQAEQVKQFANQMFTATKYVSGVQPGQKKAFIERNFPQLAQEYGPEWATASEDQIQAHMQDVAAKFGTMLGQAPEQPKQPNLITGVGPDGNPIRVADAPGVTPYIKPNHAEQFDPESAQNTAEMIASGQIPMLSGSPLKSKWGQEVVKLVKDLNSGFSAADYKSGEQALKQFTSGKNGNTVRSLNVAVQHLEQLQQLGEALNNGDIPSLNKAAILWKKNTGQAAPTTFEAAKKIVTDEVVKAVIGAGGGVADREEAANTISSANSPAQLNQVIETYMGLMTGQLNGLRQQYSESTGRQDFERFLLPETRRRLETHVEGNQGASAKQAPPAALKYLKAHPEAKAAFKAKYGYLP